MTGYSPWRTTGRLLAFMPGIAPMTKADAMLFGNRYLPLEYLGALLSDHDGGDTLARWWARLDAGTRDKLRVDCMLADGSLPYGQRLLAVERNARRDAYLAEG